MFMRPRYFLKAKVLNVLFRQNYNLPRAMEGTHVWAWKVTEFDLCCLIILIRVDVARIGVVLFPPSLFVAKSEKKIHWETFEHSTHFRLMGLPSFPFRTLLGYYRSAQSAQKWYLRRLQIQRRTFLLWRCGLGWTWIDWSLDPKKFVRESMDRITKKNLRWMSALAGSEVLEVKCKSFWSSEGNFVTASWVSNKCKLAKIFETPSWFGYF